MLDACRTWGLICDAPQDNEALIEHFERACKGLEQVFPTGGPPRKWLCSNQATILSNISIAVTVSAALHLCVSVWLESWSYQSPWWWLLAWKRVALHQRNLSCDNSVQPHLVEWNCWAKEGFQTRWSCAESWSRPFRRWKWFQSIETWLWSRNCGSTTYY